MTRPAVRIVAVGRLAADPVAALCREYVRRLQRLCPLSVEEVRDLPALRARAAKVPGPKVLLDERGRLLDSRAFADLLFRLREEPGVPCFLIGGADGFASEDRQSARWILSLSPMTLPHRIARLLLCEQIYRAVTIRTGHPYHRGSER